MTNGTFITFEGGEGSGKTTVLRMLEDELLMNGFKVVSTREPGGIKIAEQIRSIILDPNNREMDGRTEALLYAAARRQHLIEKILPSLRQGRIVLCDRFIDSSLSYQGVARGIGMDKINLINQFALDDCMPQLTLYFDIDPKIGLARIHADNKREINRLDQEHIDFHERVREGYLQLVHQFPKRIHLIQAEHSIESVFKQVEQVVKQYLLDKKREDRL